MYCKRKLKSRQLIKRLRLGNTKGRQHRFSYLTILSPIWLGTYEYMKSTLSVWNRASRVNFSDLVKNFQIWPCFCVHWGLAKVSRPLDITKVGARSEKPPKNWNILTKSEKFTLEALFQTEKKSSVGYFSCTHRYQATWGIN